MIRHTISVDRRMTVAEEVGVWEPSLVGSGDSGGGDGRVEIGIDDWWGKVVLIS